MDKLIFQEHSGNELIEMLDSNADEVENMSYQIHLDKTELSERKSTFARLSIEEARIIEEKKAIVDEFKLKLKPLNEEIKMVRTEIKTGARDAYGKCYKIIDFENERVGYYNERGQLVFDRPATHDERQTTIMSTVKKAM
jgi:hypothetical protein